MATQGQAARGLFWSTVERVSTQGISFIVVLLLARLLGPHNYGLVTLAATIALFGQMLIGETFSQALIQEPTVEAAHASSLFWILMAAGLFAATVQFCAASELGNIFGQPELPPILRALSPLLLFSALQAVPTALFRRELDFRSIAAASTSGTLLGGIVGVTLAFAGFGVWSLVANLLVQNVVVTATIWRRSRFWPELNFSQPHFRALWSYGQYTFLLRIAAFTANQSPRLLVGYLFGPAALGAFSLGLRLVEILYQLLTIPATNVIVPMVARIREDSRRLENAILTATQLGAMVSVPIYVALAVTASVGIPLVFGERWMASVPLVQILCFYGIVGACGLIWQAILGGLGRPDITLTATTAAAIVSVTVLLLTARWGLVAAATAFVFRGYITLPFMPLVIARLTNISAAKQYRVYVPVAIAAAAMAIVIELSMTIFGNRLAAPVLLATALIFGAMTYISTLYVLARPALRTGFSFLSQLRPGQNPVL